MRPATVLLVVLVVACGYFDGSPTTTRPETLLGADTPEEAVRTWLAELADRDYQSTIGVVPDDQLALLTAVEGRSAEQALAMLREGVPSRVRQNFWRAFAESFPAFARTGLDEVVVGEAERFTIGGRTFAAVDLVLEERVGSGEVITSRDSQGRWWIDLLATLGPSFARPLRDWLGGVPATGEGALVRRALAEHASSLQAALRRQPLGDPSAAAAAELRYLLAELPPPGGGGPTS